MLEIGCFVSAPCSQLLLVLHFHISMIITRDYSLLTSEERVGNGAID